MYSVNNKKVNKKCKISDVNEIINVPGFLMGSKTKSFKISDSSVKSVKISNKKLANPIASSQVSKKYKKLLEYLTDLLIDDDDSGDTYREALNQIEKFRLQIKNKYREFLTKKELEKMSKQLSLLKKEANKKLDELNNSLYEVNTSKRSR